MTELKKILHVLASNKFSGAENVVCTIIQKFKNEYDMAYCSPFGPIEDSLKKQDIKYYGIKKLNPKNVKQIIQEFNPDIIEAHDYTASVIVSFVGFKGKIISHLHINAKFAKTWNLKTILYSLRIPKFNKVIGVSDSVINEAIFKEKIKDKYTTIYNYTDKEKIINLAKQNKEQKKYDLFFIGRLNELKNPIEFIEIIKGLNNKNIKAVMIGDGELKKECQNKIEEYNLQENIEMIGFVENPFPIIKKCKIGIMPSHVEGFGLTAIESMILNKPIFNSGVGGLNEIFKDMPELICKNRREYCIKINDILNNKKTEKKFEHLIEKYTNESNWKDMMIKIYE